MNVGKVHRVFSLADGKYTNDLVTSPVKKCLRGKNPDCETLAKDVSERFNYIVATLLWIMKSSRLNLKWLSVMYVLGCLKLMKMIEKTQNSYWFH